jgi:hypothetical protein
VRKTYNIAILSILAASAFVTMSGQQGVMHGGQSPILGAHIYVLTPAQSTTQGAASVSLLTSGDGSDQIGWYVTTQSPYGSFTLPAYNCPSANAPIYLYGSGGDAQTGYGASGNPAISQAVYVGPCGSINAQTFIYMDEVTTVALAYAVAGYATDPRHISYSGSQASLTGIENAFANGDNLANTQYGYAYDEIPSGDAKAPQATVNTLANALASCINQAPGQDYCSSLFSATSVNGVAPPDVATAVMNIAHNPANSTSPNIVNGTNIGSIMNLASVSPQFTPVLPSMPIPNDLNLGLLFTSSNFGYPTALAIDGSGNAWIASQQFSPSLPNGSVVEIASPTSMLANNVTYPVNYTPQTEEPESIAVDAASQNIWIGTDDAVEELSTTGGAPASGSPFLKTDPNFGGGYGLNLDSAGNVWIAAYSSVYELSATGSLLSPSVSPLCGAGYCLPTNASAEPSALALDASNNVWVTDLDSNALVELSSQGSLLNNIGPTYNPNPLDNPWSVAIDANKNVWVANDLNDNFVEYSPNEQTSLTFVQAVTPTPGSAPVLTFVAMDGAGNSWYSLDNAFCSNSTTCFGVAEVSAGAKPLSGPGYDISGNNNYDADVYATAIDGSGDVWMLNKNAQSVTELVGAATPVVTPLALAVSTNSLGVRP